MAEQELVEKYIHELTVKAQEKISNQKRSQ